MTGKLIKYEFKSSIKLISVIWAALIAASILLGIVSNTFRNVFSANFYNSHVADVLELLSGLLYGGIMVAMIVITVIIIIMRFYKGLLGEEGYLMHTLPVKPWQLITAKGIVASAIVLVSTIVALLSIFIILGLINFNDIVELFGAIAEVSKEHPSYILIGIEFTIITILSIIGSVYQIYVALAIGQLVNKYRIIVSLAAYIGIGMVLSILGVIAMLIGASSAYFSNYFYSMFMNSNYFAETQLAMLFMFIITAVQLIAFHIITERIITLKLNLQ